MALFYCSFVEVERDVFVGSIVVDAILPLHQFVHLAALDAGAPEEGMTMEAWPVSDVPDELELGRWYPLSEMLQLGHTDLDSLGPKTREWVLGWEDA